MDSAFPRFLTHRTRGEPFRSITEAPPTEWPAIVARLSDDTVSGRGRFDDPDYLPRRLSVEQRLRAAFEAKGGRPVLHHPSYWLVGQPRSTPPGVRVFRLDLDVLDPAVVSFTWDDSLITFDPAYRAQAPPRYRHPAAGVVYRVDELPRVLDEVEPLDGRPGWCLLEAQLWIRPDPRHVRQLA